MYNYVGVYGQDSWKANQHLTVNFGLRWEPYIPFWNRNGHAENFTVAGFTAAGGGVTSSLAQGAPALRLNNLLRSSRIETRLGHDWRFLLECIDEKIRRGVIHRNVHQQWSGPATDAEVTPPLPRPTNVEP